MREMIHIEAESVAIALQDRQAVSGLWLKPPAARACLVLAHGAGAGITHPSMAALAEGFAQRGVATLRFNFPYMERGSKRPDPPELAHRAVRAAVDVACRRAGELPLFAGGRSFGGRMTSQAQAVTPLPGVRGLVFFAFPLHPEGKPSTARAEHLADIEISMLFIQGTRDKLADMQLLRPVLGSLGTRATPLLLEAADHSFHVPASTGRRDAEVLDDVLDGATVWMLDRADRGGELAR